MLTIMEIKNMHACNRIHRFSNSEKYLEKLKLEKLVKYRKTSILMKNIHFFTKHYNI